MSELSPELIDQDKDTDTPDMLHIRSFVPGRSLCGIERDPSKPVTWGPVDCVVCTSLWGGMSETESHALSRFWGGA